MMGDNDGVVDGRKAFIVSLIGSYYGKSRDETVDLYENEELASFLDDPSALLLTARLAGPHNNNMVNGSGSGSNPNSTKVVLDNKCSLEEEDESVLIFYKRSPESLTPENIHKHVGSVTMTDSPAATLYQILNKAIIPGFSAKTSRGSKMHGDNHHKLQDSMFKLEQALNAEIQSSQNNNMGRPKGITTMTDEKSVWSTAPSYAKNANEKEIAAWIFNLIDSIDKDLKSVTDWSSGTQIFGTILNALDDIWKMGEKYYPESRMIHLLDIVGHEIMLTVQTALKAVNLWDTPFNDLEKHLLWGMTMCDKYIDVCHNLTGMLWPSDSSRQFHRGEYTPPVTAAYSERLKEILRIRSVHKQLVSLVSLADAEILHPKKCFAPFSGINPIFYNVYTEVVWRHAVEKFEKLIVPAESSISSRLLSKLNVEANAFQLLAEYKRYKELIMRPKVASTVQANREQFLLKLIGVTETIKSEFGEKKSSGSGVSASVNGLVTNTSPRVASIYYARKSLYRMKDIEQIAEAVLKDLNGYDDLSVAIAPIKQEIELFENQTYNAWLAEVSESISNKELTLNKTDAVIEFNDGRLMEVTYNPKLVNLIEEAQQLGTLGFRIPREIQDAVVEAKKFLKHAKELDQIANFHNTIGDRMIASQRPMMLEAAVALSKLVQSQNSLTWQDGDEVEKYIKSLQSLVNILAKQNNLLSQYHIQVKNKVKSLFEIDLVRQQPKWKTVMQEVRQIFTHVQDQGFKNMKSWEAHWNIQIYKVLEVKYLQGMVKVHESLPEIHIELVYRQQKLQFKPPLEEARMKYYTNLKRFLLIPKQFRGVSDENPDELIFGIIVNRNCHRFEKLYREAENCLSKVANTKNRFEEWVALGSADIDQLSKECLVTWEDFDRNFKMSKSKGQEISRLPTADERIGCFVISFAVLRFEIELLNRKYWEVLVTLLQNSIIQEMATAETFLNDATEKLRIQPTTVEEIAIANALEEQLESQVPETRQLLESIDKKNRTLALWTKDRTDLSRIKGLWENFLSLFENHQFLIGRQVETIKGSLEQQVKGLNDEAEVFKIRWDELKPKEGEMDSRMKLDDILSFIKEKRQEWNLIVERREKITESCTNIGVDKELVDFHLPAEIEEDVVRVERTWLQLEEFREGLKEYEDEDWIVFRTRPQRLEEFLQKWEAQFQNETKSDVMLRILKDVQSYKSLIPNLKFIRGDSFTEKHWYELFNILQMPNKTLGELKLGDFLKSRHLLEERLKDIQELNVRATGEITVRQALNELDAWEVEAKFDLAENLDSHKKPVWVIQDFKSLLNKLGDNQSLLQSIRTSPFYSHFADRISVWETRLGDLDEYIQNLNKVQRRWIYLEPIFSQGVLESEQQRFRRINEEYRGIMESIGIDNRVVGLCKIQGIRNRLNMLVDQLSRCQNSLNEFLEKKRSGFPRFYFLGDDDLLEILGQSTKPNVIQAHLKKLFAGIFNVDFDADFSHITAMKSVEEEVVPLKSQVKITSNVEEWLSELANEMKYTLKSCLLDCISESGKNSRDPDKYPSQILTLSNAIRFSDRAEEAIRSSKLESLLKELKNELEDYTNIQIPESHPNPKVMELKFKDLILDTIHEIDMVEFLIKEGVKSVQEWNWQKQLRFYLRNEDGSAIVKMADAEFVYSYEYQGNAPKLVHTPLTDKCYLTLTQGMRMGLGGNPYGPAGTGKTESVKALGGLLGRQVLVFNCDEGIDVKAMGRIFVGLVKCGAWGCFDEVNRLEGATLSAVSMQIQPIQIALKTGAKTVKLLDETVVIDSNAGIFVTLNPAGKGYGGRNKLPDNLKQLFRPVVMSSPDNELIAEVILYTEGFKNARKLGRKLVEIFKLSSKLLTPQTHYDWGLRALKTVLKGCGTALKGFKMEAKAQGQGQGQAAVINEEEESDILVATLRLNTLPKLTYSDCFRFDHLIKDVFPTVNFKDLGHQDLAQNVREASAELKLTVNENQVKKCLELYEQLQQRMGVVIVGPSCCGKTTVVSLLKNALLRMGQKIKTHFINPKSILRTQLLGQINLDTRQWTDGVLTLKAQQVYAEPPDVTSWIICDGDIDPEWVESLNSVLDDNRLLTLPSGWRIKFGSNVNFIFETHDLSYASPATISRMGMIFMSEEDADMKGIIETWLAEEPAENRENLAQLIQDYFYKGMSWILPQYDVIVQLPLVSIVKNALSQMRGVQNVAHMAVAMIRGFPGHLSRAVGAEFATQVLSWTGLSVPKEWKLHNLYYNARSLSLDVFQDEELDHSDNYNIESPPLVLTTDVKQILDLIKPWLEHQESFLLIGPEGSGKTMLLEYAFSQLRSTQVATIHCSGLVSPQHVLQKLTQYCITVSTNTGRLYKSKDGERLILYFKDLNLVKPDKWGTCQLIEFLQQIINYKGFYDSNLEWVGIEGIQIAGSINPGVSSAKHALSPRFTSIIRIGSMGDLERGQLETICRSYMRIFFKNRYPTHKVLSDPAKIQKLSNSTIQFYESMKTMFKASNQNHYQFTPRDLTKWILGLMRYDLEDGGQGQDSGAGDGDSGNLLEIIMAWTYETCRMFRDKLVSLKEKDNFDKALTVLVAEDWGIDNMIEKLENVYYVSEGTKLTGSVMKRRKSEDRGSAGKKKRRNSSITATIPGFSSSHLGRVEQEEMISVVEKGLAIFGREYRNLSVVLIPEVLQNVAHIDRALSARNGSIVLAGRSGVGRRTAVSIVAALHGAIPFTLKVGRNYSVKNFKADLKTAVQMSAVEGNKLYFIIEDFQLVDVIFLDMLNSLLSSGEVPGLYTPEELDGIISPLREAASLEGHTSSLYSYFAGRVKQLLRVILIMDFTNENFLRNCESNPAIYRQCFFLWMDVWSTNSLSTIPALIIEKYYKKGFDQAISSAGSAGRSPSAKNTGVAPELSKETKKATNEVFMKGFLRIYDSLEGHMSSPRRYIALIHNYANLFNQRTKHISLHMSRLSAGVSKLAGAKEVVERLKVDAAEQEVVLAKKQAEANKALELITETMRNANIQRGEVQTLREQTAKENEVLEQKKKSIDAELADIEPEVKKAQASVGSIKNEAISEIRSLRAPPEVIRDILEAVLRLMGNLDMSWNSMKLFLSQRGVKEEIRNFDARKINKKDRDAVEKLLAERPDSFSEHAAKRASAAAAPLAAWVMANVKYSRALEKIEPLERQQILIRQGLTAAEDQLDALSSELLDVDKRVEHLKKNLNQFTKEAAETEIRLSHAKETLVAAEGLVGKLEDEFTRWSKRLQEYGEELKRLPTKTLLAAAFITYLSEASEDVRERFVTLWSKALKAGPFNLLDFLSTERELRNWQTYGLPSDRLSLENGLIINELSDGTPGTTLRPYLIDPTSRARDWLKTSMEKTAQVITISLQDPKFPHELELAVRFGKVMIISEADWIEPTLVPILRGDITCQGTREMVQIGDKFVDMSPNFRIFMITRNPNPKIPPDAQAVITTVNFTTTKAGLTSQLMTSILEIEKPELREKNIELLKNVEEMKEKLSEMGDQLLLELANAQGNILENQELLNSLNKTKENSTHIENSLGQQSALEASLNKEINVYLPLAEFGSLNYFALLDLTKLNTAYQFSLGSFISLFVKTLKAPQKHSGMSSAAGSSTDARIASLQQELENAVFDHVCRSLFKEDRLAFAMSMAHAMHPKLFHENEWEAFTGQLVTDMNADSLSGFKKMMPSWINEDRTIAVLVLKTAFPGLYEKLDFVNEGMWTEFYGSNECEDHLPSGIPESCTAFQVLMIIQTLRPDRLHTAMTHFARHALGRRYLFPRPMNLSQVCSDTVAHEPILLLIQSGADPSQELRELAHVTVGHDKYIEISMGQGESHMIIEQLNEGAEKGYWICLKNLHLVTHWLDTLEKEIQKLNPHEQFRLWLTSEPHPDFPTVLAQTCLKIAYEAPQGLKKNLQQTYSNWSEEYVTGDKNILRIQSLLVLGIFHAVVQERRTFIPQGWSKFYEFNESDIRAGADVLDQLFKGPRSKEIQWQYVRGLFENAIYGGRVDNVYDVRVLVSYLDEYFNDLVLTGSASSRKSLCGGLKIPSSTNAQDYLDVINGMPEFDKPNAFGLPGNIERSWQRVTSSQVINQLKTLSRIFTDSTRYDRNIWYRELSPILNLWKKLVQGSSVARILQVKSNVAVEAPGNNNNGDPIEAFVRLENATSMKLLKFVHGHLGAISKTVRGSATPSSLVFEIGDSLLKRQTPSEWLKKWEGPSDPTVYLQGLVRRALSIMEWESKVNDKQLLDAPLDLSELLNPDTFLGAFKQQCARKLKTSMDELQFLCSWDSRKSDSRSGFSCKLTGLLLEGCSFDGFKLMENHLESLPIVRVPDCTISWISQAESDKMKKSEMGYTISVPLYYNETRERLIGSLDLPSSGEHSKWIQAGVAVFLKT